MNPVEGPIVEVINHITKLRLVWEWIGEGWSGDWQHDDPNDEPLLRFTVYYLTLAPIYDTTADYYEATVQVGYTSHWEELDDASYCTMMPYDTHSYALIKAANFILNEIDGAIDTRNYKRILEALSWMKPENLQ
jgi:hypothetical protein